MSTSVVVVESGLDPQRLIDLARGASQSVAVVVIGEGALECGVSDAQTIGLAADPLNVEGTSRAIGEYAREVGADLVVMAASAHLREVMPLLAHDLDAACVADATALRRSGELIEAERLLYGGMAIATVLLQRSVAVVSAPTLRASERVAVESRTVEAAASRRELVARRPIKRESALPGAARVVSFGRGVRSADDVTLIQGLAARLGAELGCSRPIVEDMRWLGVEHQVGLTGTTVTPQLYVAIGISGQIQHLVGMRDSKVIVAINANPAAPIFAVADVGIVGDLYEVVPRLTEALARRGA